MQPTKTYTITETITESFDVAVPAHLEGDELDDYLEEERINGGHDRRLVNVVAVDWQEQ